MKFQGCTSFGKYQQISEAQRRKFSIELESLQILLLFMFCLRRLKVTYFKIQVLRLIWNLRSCILFNKVLLICALFSFTLEFRIKKEERLFLFGSYSLLHFFHLILINKKNPSYISFFFHPTNFKKIPIYIPMLNSRLGIHFDFRQFSAPLLFLSFVFKLEHWGSEVGSVSDCVLPINGDKRKILRACFFPLWFELAHLTRIFFKSQRVTRLFGAPLPIIILVTPQKRLLPLYLKRKKCNQF